MKKQFKIGIFATSTPLTRAPSENDYSYLKSKGLEVVEAPQVRKRNAHLAGTINERVSALHDMLKDPTIDALMAYWGGANTNQILPYLDYDLFKKYPKPIIGFSDTSALLLAVNKMSGIKTYMGPAGITFDKPQPFEYSYEYFKRMIIDKEKEIVIEDAETFADDLYFLREDSDHRIMNKNEGRKIFREGKAEGEIIASNLQTLLVLAGTKYLPDLKNKILFLEEAEDESVDMIHRFLTQLTQIIDISSLKGICIGKFSSQTKFKDTFTQEMMYEDVFKNVSIPIIYDLNFGHTDPLFTIPIGGKAVVDTQLKNLILSL